MDRRCLMCFFCLLTTVSTEEVIKKEKEDDDSVTLKCSEGKFEINNTAILDLSWDDSGDYRCRLKSNDTVTVTVRVRRSENLIQLDLPATLSILLGDIAATILIGWAVYSICAQPKTKSNYQRANKASDRQNLINNSGGDTYQPLSHRSDEYSMLQPARKNKNRAVLP